MTDRPKHILDIIQNELKYKAFCASAKSVQILWSVSLIYLDLLDFHLSLILSNLLVLKLDFV